ncbi:hypothetical protein ACHAQD_000411 [Fusarium lateritium]
MAMTVNYGRENSFYLGGLALAQRELFAYFMYIGGLFWLLFVAAMGIPLIRTMSSILNPDQPLGTIDQIIDNRGRKDKPGVRDSLLGSHGSTTSTSHGCNYGAIPVIEEVDQTRPRPLVLLHVIMSMGLPLLWLAQWAFWIGYIYLSMEEFCLPSLDTLTGIGIAASAGSVVVRSYL